MEHEEKEEEVDGVEGEGVEGETEEKAQKLSLNEREKAVDAIIDELESRVVSGGTDQMNATKSELLSAKIRIKRLL